LVQQFLFFFFAIFPSLGFLFGHPISFLSSSFSLYCSRFCHKNKATKTPKLSFSYASELLGKTWEDPSLEHLKNYISYDLVQSKDGKIEIVYDETTKYTPEDIVGMLLKYAQEIASKSMEAQVKEVVITVENHNLSPSILHFSLLFFLFCFWKTRNNSAFTHKHQKKRCLHIGPNFNDKQCWMQQKSPD
jgi:hypothetical protein